MKILAIAIMAILAGCAEPVVEPETPDVPAPKATTVPPVLSFELETVNETIRVNMDLASEFLVTFEVTELMVAEQVYQAGNHVVLLPLEFGNSQISAILDDGTSTFSHEAQVARLSQANLSVHYNGYLGATDEAATIWFNIDAPYSASYYDGTNVAHPGYGTVHDFMVEWENQTGVEFEYAFSSGLGYTVSKIDGVGSPVSVVPGDPSENFYWLYTIDGESAELGISAQEMTPGANVAWCLGGCQ